ncbi:bifunctional 3-oxoadipate enol-lactonase/4-carboxymuconolactone decarboxylase PcaDC [Streptacidiphilus sp. PAMC 29251]
MTNASLHHLIDGASTAPPLLLGPSLGTTTAVWDPQIPALARHYRTVRWDLPGHGGSPADLLPGTGATIADLGTLVLALADRLGIERFAYAGVSLGGAVGLWLAVHHPERVSSLALVCSSAHFGGPEAWHERAALVRKEGIEPLTTTSPARWFTPGFGGDTLLADLRAVDPDGYAACCDALADYDARPELHRVTAPTLVVAGREDPAAPPAHSRELVDGIPGASLTEIAAAAHLAGVEQPQAVLAALLAHLQANDHQEGTSHHQESANDHQESTGDAARHAAGMTVRRAVLGGDHVDRAVARTTDFTAPFQDFITRYAWGEIWTRPGLDRRARSCVTLTALVAGGHHEELAMHVRAGLRNGLSREEIQEVLLQTAIYCGVPAANAAFAIADRVLSEQEKEEN